MRAGGMMEWLACGEPGGGRPGGTQCPEMRKAMAIPAASPIQRWRWMQILAIICGDGLGLPEGAFNNSAMSEAGSITVLKRCFRQLCMWGTCAA